MCDAHAKKPKISTVLGVWGQNEGHQALKKDKRSNIFSEEKFFQNDFKIGGAMGPNLYELAPR